MTATQVRQQIGELVNRIAYRDEEVVIVRHGRPMAALISYSKYELLRKLVEEHEDQLDRERILKRSGEEKIPLEQALKDLAESGRDAD